MKNSIRYNWFENRNKIQFLNNNGLNLDTSSLKIEILDTNKKFSITAKGKTYRADALAYCKITGSKELAWFGISIQRDKLFILRLNKEKKYNPEVIYKRKDFLSICTLINRKLKG